MSHTTTANGDGTATESTDGVTPGSFAFGLDTVETDDGTECGCPTNAYGNLTGERPLPMDHVIAAYDKILRVEENETTGVVDEETASDAWLSAIDSVRHDNTKSDFHADNAERLADDFGWL